MIHIISSTNRKGSISRLIANQYAEILRSKGESSEIVDLVDLPNDFIATALYDQAGKNEIFNEMRAKIEEAQKYVFIIPEYNGSFPGVFKAFVDGLKYPSTFKNKKAAMVGVSSGIQGGALALSHANDIFNYLGMHVLATRVKLYKIEEHMKEQSVSHPPFLQLLHLQAEQLIEF